MIHPNTVHPSNPDPASKLTTETSRLAREKLARYIQQMARQRDAQPPLVLARALDRLSGLVERLLERAT